MSLLRKSIPHKELWPLGTDLTVALGAMVLLYLGVVVGWIGALWTGVGQ